MQISAYDAHQNEGVRTHDAAGDGDDEVHEEGRESRRHSDFLAGGGREAEAGGANVDLTKSDFGAKWTV